jgi:OOP family OmpA-OmpF porin
MCVYARRLHDYLPRYLDIEVHYLPLLIGHLIKKLHAEIQNAKIDSILATGHTDSIGKASYNKKLSIRRAQAVKDYLVKLGIPSERIFIEGKGATQPVASNKTSQGRARNRRVDVEVIGTKAP